MALFEFNKMIADESEPSLYGDLSNLSDSTSSLFTDEDPEINNLLQRTSISLFNVSTPHEQRRNRYRSGSHYSIQSDRKKRKYRQYSNENKYDKTKEVSTIKIESLETEIKQKNNVSCSPTISIKYAQALKEIETLQTQINLLKSERSITPLFVRRKSLQSSSMIKKCLFRNSSTVLRPNQHNSTRSSQFGVNSTCMTIDIEDKSPETGNEVFHDFFLISNHESKQNPVSIQVSPTSTMNITNISEEPLISHTHKANKSTNKIRDFISKFMKCPEFLRSIKNHKQKTTFKNKVYPIPKVVVFSPGTQENDSGNDSYVQQIRLEAFNCNTEQMDKIIKEMSQCAEDLSQKLHVFRNVLDQCMNQKNIK